MGCQKKEYEKRIGERLHFIQCMHAAAAQDASGSGGGCFFEDDDGVSLAFSRLRFFFEDDDGRLLRRRSLSLPPGLPRCLRRRWRRRRGDSLSSELESTSETFSFAGLLRWRRLLLRCECRLRRRCRCEELSSSLSSSSLLGDRDRRLLR